MDGEVSLIIFQGCAHAPSYLTQSVLEVILQKSTPLQIRQLILY